MASVLLRRKLDDLSAALREAQQMDARQLQLQATHPDLYDPQMHHGAMTQAVQSLYTRLEEVLKDMLVMTDGSVPATSTWHRDLLLVAATAVPGVRPAVITESTHAVLGELLSFRHVARSAYVGRLRGADVRKNVELAFRELPKALNEIAAAEESLFGAAATAPPLPGQRRKPKP